MTSHVVLGREVHLPVEVRDASAGTVTYLADAAAAASLLPDGLVPVRVTPRHTIVTLVMVDYRDNDLGDYDEAAIQLTVTRPGLADRLATLKQAVLGRPQTYTIAMPVDQPFTLQAGRQIWGFPKTLDDISIEQGGDQAVCRWSADGESVWTLTVPTGTSRSMPLPPLTAWTTKDGHLHRTSFAMSASRGGLFLRPGARVRLELGSHPVAQTLRSLGLPRKPLLATWMQDARATFGEPERVSL